ncbi:MAG TPA: RidA family protein [Candidatus Deferrimicrobium sp.]|nr:RidA family protein [Candidatus Deferrimicrobium sp.]
MKQTVVTNKAPKAIGPYSQGVKIANLVFASGQLPINPETGKMAEGIEAQAHQSLKNLCAILEEAGSDISKVVKTTIFLKDLNDFQTVNSVYANFFPGDFPARSTVQVARLPLDAGVEIEAIATL